MNKVPYRNFGPGVQIGALRAALLICCLLLSATISSRASLMWNWSYQSTATSGPNSYTGTGTITTEDTPTTSGGFTGYLLTGIDGSWIVSGAFTSITALLPPGDPVLNNDNLLSSSSPQLDLAGIAFSSGNGTNYNVFYQSGYGVLNSLGANDGGGTFSATIQSAPEPSSWLLLGTGAVVATAAARRSLNKVRHN